MLTASAAANWTGGGADTKWSTPENWSPEAVPTSDDVRFWEPEDFVSPFKDLDEKVVLFDDAYNPSAIIYVRKVGTADNPLVFEATSSANGLNAGKEWMIGYNSNEHGYLRLKSGTWSTGSGYLMQLGANSSKTWGELAVTDGAILTLGGNLNVLRGKVTLENASLIVGNGYNVNFGQYNGHDSVFELKVGGVFTTPFVRQYPSSSGGGTFLFNGGVLKANKADGSGFIQNSADLTVKVGAGGGTIDAGGKNISIKRPIEPDGEDGGMKFIGGGTITLGGANTYTGGTTIELGTTVATADADAKAAVLDHGLVVDGLKTFTDGDYTVFEYTGGTLTQADLDNVRLVNCAEGSDKAIVDDNKIVVGFTAGGLKKTTSTKVWSGKTLEQIKDANFTARMWGRSVSEEFRLTPDSAYGYNKKFDEDDGGSVTNIIVEFQIYNNQTKCVVVSFTNGVDGVYATALGADYIKGNNLGHDFCSNEDMSSTVAETYDSQSYGAFDLHVWLPIVVQAGETLFIDGDNYAPSIINHGTIAKTGDGTAAIPFDTSSKGVTIVSNGTLKVASKTGSGTDHTIRVADGAAFDVNGTPLTLNVILEKGARFVNTGTGLGYRNAQTVQLTLEGDAYVGGNTFGLVGPSYAATSLDLGSHTLVIDMGDKEFSLVNTTIVGAGMIHVTSGRFSTRRDDSTGADCTISIGASGLFENNEHFTVSNFVNNGSIEYASSWGRGMLEVTGGFETKTASFPKLTLTGATVKATGAVATVLDTFSASGTVTIDASAITAQQLKDSADGRIAVLTVPSDANTSGADWKVSNEPIRDTRVKWVTNGDTKTLYLAKPNGLILVVR